MQLCAVQLAQRVLCIVKLRVAVGPNGIPRRGKHARKVLFCGAALSAGAIPHGGNMFRAFAR